jgi:hypothetical protein
LERRMITPQSLSTKDTKAEAGRLGTETEKYLIKKKKKIKKKK